jgi:hypothetical protein
MNILSSLKIVKTRREDEENLSPVNYIVKMHFASFLCSLRCVNFPEKVVSNFSGKSSREDEPNLELSKGFSHLIP